MKKSMRKLPLIALSLFCMTTALWANGQQEAGAVSEEKKQEKIVLRFAETNPDNDPIVEASMEFIRLVEEKSGGRIKIQMFPAGQLGGNNENIQGLQMGAIDITRTKPGYLKDIGAEKMGVYSLPYLFRDIDHARAVLTSPTGTELLDSIQVNDTKVVGLGYYANAPRSFFTKTPVRRLADMTGLKLRVQTSQIYIDLINSFGASPTPIAFSELYSALQSGVVDGAEQPLKGYYNKRFYEICPYFTFDNHQADPSIVIISEMTWKKLSADDQKLLRDALAEASSGFNTVMDGLTRNYRSELEGMGVEFIELNDSKDWQDAASLLYATYGAGYEELISDIKAIR
jgi:tripartite ATP-independent transporter DctP family solute receptor